MKKLVITAFLYTISTALVLGIGYPLVITGIAHFAMRDKADGQLIRRNGETVGSVLIGQPFTGAGYFHSRPSSAGAGYNAEASSGSNLGPTSRALQQRVDSSVRVETIGSPVPVDLVTASGSGLDPDITPASALYQVERVAKERHVSVGALRAMVAKETQARQFGILGEPRVNVLQLNLSLAQLSQGK